MRYDCVKKQFTEIEPKKNPDMVIDPKMFGDDWSEGLDEDDFHKIDDYFRWIFTYFRKLFFYKFQGRWQRSPVKFQKWKFKRRNDI